ncbi:MAG: hypothetical protein FAF03_11800 [Epsilonproteobacteria bacterium]|nr:hypothetical protein [Campylobacterota bacterium]
MYYILNETNQLIAADEEMLSLCGVAHIDKLSSKIAKDDINLHLTGEGEIIIQTEEDKKTYSVTETALSSLLGYLHLIQISTDIEDNDEVSITTPAIEDDSTDLIDSIIHDEEEKESLDILEEETATPLLSEVEEEEEITFGDHLSVDDDIMELKDTETTEEETPLLGSTEEDEETELFDLLGDTKENTDEVSEEIFEDTTNEEEPLDLGLTTTTEDILEPEVAEININIDEISQKIGISSDDYQNFLNEFIDTALELEKDLQSDDETKRAEATSTLSHLAEVLHLPLIGDIITNISNTDKTNQRSVIESFYGTLARISTTENTEEAVSIVDETPEEEKLELFDDIVPEKEPMIQEEVTPRKTSSGPSFGTISLDGIKPKHFDFQLEEAANDLSLPVELIEEFVHDFIDQAHIETKKMLEAYEDGDLDAIQKIGHLLKGASSNLRINPLSDTLYKIQFCEDPSQLEMLIKDYWAHFLSFENQINVISN